MATVYTECLCGSRVHTSLEKILRRINGSCADAVPLLCGGCGWYAVITVRSAVEQTLNGMLYVIRAFLLGV